MALAPAVMGVTGAPLLMLAAAAMPLFPVTGDLLYLGRRKTVQKIVNAVDAKSVRANVRFQQ